MARSKGGKNKPNADPKTTLPVASQAAATRAASKKRKSDSVDDSRPAKKKARIDGSISSSLLKDEEFTKILSALNASRLHEGYSHGNIQLKKSKFGSLITVLDNIRAQFPGTPDGIALLAIIQRDDQFRVSARKALDQELGRPRCEAWLSDAQLRLQRPDAVTQQDGLKSQRVVTVSEKLSGLSSDPTKQNGLKASRLPNGGAQPGHSLKSSHPLDDGGEYDSDDAPSIGTKRSSIGRESLPSVGDANLQDQEDGEIISNIDSAGDTRLWQLSLKEQELQTRYNGITEPNDLVYCGCCLKRGHMTADCPDSICDICDTDNIHHPYYCPQKLKCLRCRRRGHKADTCELPSVPAGGVGDECDLCGYLGHYEGECTYLGYSRIPKKGQVPQIRASEMRVFCCNCGAKGHWGGDCPRSRKTELRGRPWCFTAAYAAMFIMPDDQAAGVQPNGSTAHQSTINGTSPQDKSPQTGGLREWQLRQLSDYV